MYYLGSKGLLSREPRVSHRAAAERRPPGVLWPRQGYGGWPGAYEAHIGSGTVDAADFQSDIRGRPARRSRIQAWVARLSRGGHFSGHQPARRRLPPEAANTVNRHKKTIDRQSVSMVYIFCEHS